MYARGLDADIVCDYEAQTSPKTTIKSFLVVVRTCQTSIKKSNPRQNESNLFSMIRILYNFVFAVVKRLELALSLLNIE